MNTHRMLMLMLIVSSVCIAGTDMGAAEDVNVNFERHFDGPTYTTAVSGNYAYVGQGQDLILDTSNPSQPLELDISHPVTPTLAGNQNTTSITVSLESTSTLSIESEKAPPNSTITIPVSVANVTNISGISFNLLYNSSVVTITSVSAKESFVGSSITSNIDNVNGITIIVLTNSNLISASEETPVIDIVFNIIGGSGSSTSLDMQNVEFSDIEFNPYKPEIVDGMITVGIKGDLNDNGRVDNGGGGGSGGGGSSGEDFYNIVTSENDRQSVFKNSDVSFIFDLEGNIVRHINFTALNSAGTVAAKVEILDNTSTLVSTPPPYEIYKNLNIWVGNYGWATEKNMADTTVSFMVEKSWVTDNNIDETTIALYRYSDDNWDKLVTRKVTEDSNSFYFEAETSGFSPFAVTGKTIGEPGGEGIIEPTVTAEKTPIPTPTEKKGISGFSLFAGLSVLLIAVQLLRKKE